MTRSVRRLRTSSRGLSANLSQGERAWLLKQLDLPQMMLLAIGMGGYIGGRTIEKVAGTVKAIAGNVGPRRALGKAR